MKAISVKYERLYNVGNYEHAKFGVELAVEDGEKASDVMEQAKRFVRQMNTEGMDARKQRLDRARRIVENKESYMFAEVQDAERTIADYENEQQERIPF